MNPGEHGTAKRYRQGCRCDDCTRANREYMKAYYDARKAAGRPIHKTRAKPVRAYGEGTHRSRRDVLSRQFLAEIQARRSPEVVEMFEGAR